MKIKNNSDILKSLGFNEVKGKSVPEHKEFFTSGFISVIGFRGLILSCSCYCEISMKALEDLADIKEGISIYNYGIKATYFESFKAVKIIGNSVNTYNYQNDSIYLLRPNQNPNKLFKGFEDLKDA